jgi:hypothetical protein
MAIATMRTILSSSVAICITGAVNSGKTWQILSLLTAEVDGEPIATPTLYVLAEASAEGTAGEVLLDPSRCCVWPATDCEDALEAVLACFPESGPLTLGEAKAAAYKSVCRRAANDKRVPPPPPPASTRDGELLRSIVVDTMSTLYTGSAITGGRILKREAEAKGGGKPMVQRAGKQGAPWNDPRNLGLYAAKQCGDLIDRLNGVTQHHRGLILLVTVHTCPAIEMVSGAEGEAPVSMAVGETPKLGAPKAVKSGMNIPAFSATWDALAAKMNIIWHVGEDVPDFRSTPRADINGGEKPPEVFHFAITMKGRNYPNLGSVLWVKRQGGEGPLGIFNELPMYWHPSVPCELGISAISPKGPNLGAVLAYAIAQCKRAQPPVAPPADDDAKVQLQNRRVAI